ncbi:MAG TPA: Tn3 family transposase [Coleofasciculaceae cyanobacterium]
MKRNWQPEELIEHWTLLPNELALLTNKTDHNRLGFALLLKFFQYAVRFPNHQQEMPSAVIDYVALQVGVSPQLYENYDWQGRSVKYHRAQIREFFGFREAKVADAASLTEWLAAQVLAYDLKIESLQKAAYQRLRALKIEPPTPERLERITRSAMRTFEERFCATTVLSLSPATIERLDALLKPDVSDTDTQAGIEESSSTLTTPLAALKADPGRIGLDSLQKEVAKLQLLRQLCLPDKLFERVSSKVLQTYRQRVAVEPPRELRRHPASRRYTFLAAFCWLRSQEITDNLVELLISISQTLDADEFIASLQGRMQEALAELDREIPKNPSVKLLNKHNGWIRLSPFPANPEPTNLARLKTEIERCWPMTSLLDMLKETDLGVNFTQHFKSVATRENLDPKVLQKRLLICLYGLGTNTGIRRLSSGLLGENYADLLYVRRRFIHKAQLRNAIAEVVNATLETRKSHIWGEGTTTCASDSKKFGAWDQNLMTEWHIRYGGRGVMIYWHVEKNSACIYSQLKTCSSSEVAAMIEGVLRHCTTMKLEKNFVDSHGQSEVAFAFCHLLGFELMPRLKGIHRQKLYRPLPGQADAYPNLQPVITRPINWDLIRQQYNQMIKYATALRLGTAETEAILKRFTRQNLMHPTYRSLAELGKVIKTIFLCQYLNSEPLRREINEGLNVVENWNNANGFIFYGKGKEIATNRLEDQEIAVLSLHLLQSCLVYVNTLMIQQVLSQAKWMELMQPEDLRALTPLIWGHVNPYGTFQLDLEERLLIETAA